MESSDAAFGAIAAFLSSVTWAVGSATYSRLSHRYPAHTVNFSRAICALPCFFLLSALVSLNRGETPFSSFSNVTGTHVSWLVLSNIASYAFGDILFFASSRCVGVPTALAVSSVFPLISALCGWIFSGQTLTFSLGLGVLLTVTGTVFVVLGDKAVQAHKQTPPAQYRKGILLAFATAIAWSVNTLAASKGGAGLSPFDANAVRMSMALVLVPAIGFFVERRVQLKMTAADLKQSLPVLLIESVGGSCLFVYGMSKAPLAVASTLTSLAPVLSLPYAVAKGWERFSYRKSVGVVLAVVGIWYLV